MKIPAATEPPQIVEIEWLDAAIHPEFDGPGGKAPGRVTVRTSGYYFEKNKHEVKVAVDYDPESGDIRTPSVIAIKDIARFTVFSRARRSSYVRAAGASKGGSPKPKRSRR